MLFRSPTEAMLRLPADDRLKALNDDLYEEAIARYFAQAGDERVPNVTLFQ